MLEKVDLSKNSAVESSRDRNERIIKEIDQYLDEINADVEEIRMRIMEIKSEDAAIEEKWA